MSVFSNEELLTLKIENIKYIVRLKKFDESYCYALVLKNGYTQDNCRLLSADNMLLLSGPNGEHREEINKLIIEPIWKE